MRRALPLLLLLALSGCVRTAANIVTFPVRAASQGVDWATTSQDEADRNRGRAIRKQEKSDREAAEKQRRAQERAAKRAAAEPR
jgi:hypothetical protein